jgi:hypothetical protein
MSIGTSTLIATSTGRRPIAPVTAPTGPATAAVIVLAAAAIAVEATAADTEVAAAGATADSQTGIGRGANSLPDRCAASGWAISTAALS